MQGSLLAEGSLSLGMPLGLLLVTPRAAKYQVPEASPVLILGGRLCIALWGHSSTALSTTLFFSAVNHQIVTQVRRCLLLVRMEPMGV